jgi:hypothetical protein
VHQATGAGTSVLSIFKDRRAGDENGPVALDPLHEPPPARWQIGHHFRPVLAQPLELDHVNVGSETWCEATAR